MKRLLAICVLAAFCGGQTFVHADNDKEKDKDKKVPPGLAKKGGVPPGQAKKEAQSEGTGTTVTAPAPPTATTAPAPSAPASTTPTAAKPAPTTPTATAPTQTEPKKPATLAEQKVKLDNYTHTINDATKRPHLKNIALAQIAKETGVSVDHLEQQDKNHPEIGTCGLLYGNFIAKHSGAKFGDLVAARLKGKHWAEIATAHNVGVGPMVQKASDVSAVVKAAQTAAAK
jgi:hypothetical protein